MWVCTRIIWWIYGWEKNNVEINDYVTQKWGIRLVIYLNSTREKQFNLEVLPKNPIKIFATKFKSECEICVS